MANGDSTELFDQADRAAARCGNAPYFLCMDANVDITEHPRLLQMLQTGWSNVAEGTPDHNQPTYGGTTDWDRVTKVSGATRIDYILANAAGRTMVTDFCYLRNLPAKSHVGLKLTLDTDRCDQTALRFVAPCGVH